MFLLCLQQVAPDLPDAHLGVLFIHNEGYSTMCGHAIMALGRYAIDYGYVETKEPETQVNIQCPCGLVKAFVNVSDGKTGQVRFHSVPAFAFATGEFQLTKIIHQNHYFYSLST